jgi:transposase
VAQNFLPCERDQQYLMPPSLTEWLPEDHLVWFVIDAVDQMDLSGFRASYRADGWGRAAHDPAMMVAVMLYAYCIGERSSRRIERRCLEDVAFRVLTANQRPDHTTIARFRQRHTEALAHLFVEVLRLCQRAGLVQVGLVALDGTKLAGAASLDANRTREQIEAQVAQMLAEAEALDAAEDADQDGGGQPPAVLRGRAERLRRLTEAKAQLDTEDAAAAQAHARHLQRRAAAEAEQGRKLRGRKPKPPQRSAEARRNTADPDSRVMKTSGGWVQGYNGQALVTAGQIIVAAQAVNDQADVAQLTPMLQAGAANLAAIGCPDAIGVALADAGYYSDANANAAGGPELLIATTNRHKRDHTPPRGRIPTNLSIMGRMERRLRTKRGKALYRQRSQTVEPVFGQIKCPRGITRLLRRGLTAADSEWKLICATHNLLKLWRAAPAC